MMLKKIILFILLSFSLLGARDVELVALKGFSTPGYYSDGSMDILINYHDLSPNHSDDDWLGIFKKGSNNEKKNAVSLKRVGDMDSGEACPSIACDESYPRFLRVPLDSGEYEAKFFRSNENIPEKTLSFSVKKLDSQVTSISQSYDAYRNKLYVMIRGINSHVTPSKKDWIGLYRVGTSNAKKNIIKRARVYKLRKNSRNYKWKIRKLDLPTGDYELRYFLNNSFTTYKKSEPFHFIKDNPNPIMKNVSLSTYLPHFVHIKFKHASGNKKDWIGIYKEGDKRNRANLRGWGYNEEGKTKGKIQLIETEVGRYDVVFFENDGYKVLATSKLIIRDDTRP